MDISSGTLALDVVVPCYNEEDTLQTHVRELHEYLIATVSDAWRITIADNASTDRTAAIADELAAEFGEVRAVHLDQKGRGRALKAVWRDSSAQVLVYVDEDLSTDLAALAPLIAPLRSGHSDLAIGTRLSGSSRVIRGGKREFISRSYNFLLRSTFSVQFTDAQCGFKAIRGDVAARLLPLVEDDQWFFDTELLILAERAGLRIHEVPVDWVDDPRSSVNIGSTATQDLKGMWRVGRNLSRGRIPLDNIYQDFGRHPFVNTKPSLLGQLLRFGVIGVLSTIAFALLYLALHPALGSQPANFVALLATTIANTALNRRFTFGIRGAGAARHQLQGLMVFGLAWLITAGSLVTLNAVAPNAGPGIDVVILTAANLVATILRFVLLRAWVFRRSTRTSSPALSSRADEPSSAHTPPSATDGAPPTTNATSSPATDGPRSHAVGGPENQVAA